MNLLYSRVRRKSQPPNANSTEPPLPPPPRPPASFNSHASRAKCDYTHFLLARALPLPPGGSHYAAVYSHTAVILCECVCVVTMIIIIIIIIASL